MTWSEARSVLELASFASAVVVALAALVGLVQLRLASRALTATRDQLEHAKRDLQIRSRREAVVLAAERCEKFAEQILPRWNLNVEKLSAAGVSVIRWNLANTEFDGSSIVHADVAGKWLETIRKNDTLLAAVTAMANDLEAFAIYFARGAADEETAYPVLGALFCEEVECLSPYLVKARHKQVQGLTSGPFQNTVDLYTLWHLRSRQKELEAEANKINLQLSGIDVKPIRPIGVE